VTTRPDRADPTFYPDDLLLQIQRMFAILADLEFQYEVQRDCLESWSGPRKEKERLMAELERCHGSDRARLMSCLDGFRGRARAFERTAMAPTRRLAQD
jgi:hypothetical protein